MNYWELAAFIAYFLVVIGVGIYFFTKSRGGNEKDYFLGGRNMNGIVAAFSAGASDMSAWVLMGLPGAICVLGFGQIWISIGLLIGTILAWIFIAPKLRRYAIKAGDSITIPQFFTNRFKEKNPTLRIACAVIFMVAYCLYAASSITACGTVFAKIMPAAEDYKVIVEIVAALIIVAYTLLGGFNAVCWTDFIQGMIMLVALMVVPIIAFIMLQANGPVAAVTTTENYYSFLSSGIFDWASIADILTGLGWGLGYFGMPHIVIRYMSIRSEKEMRRSQMVGIVWFIIILVFATLVALVAHEYLGSVINGDNKESVFIILVERIFNYGALALIGGLLLSAIIAAAMSTADSQLLAASSAFSSDIYKAVLRKEASDKEMLWVGRIEVAVILVIALLIALFVSSSIMSLVSAAWSIFGASFGPVMILALYWRRFNFKGACAAIISGFAVSVLWMVLFNFEYYGFTSLVYNTGLYEIIPGFVMGLVVAIIVSILTKEPSAEVTALFDSVGRSVENYEVEVEEEVEVAEEVPATAAEISAEE